ncbi:MAG: DEAD/DEAH box helicase [Nitrososphaeria archaeon]
MNEILITGVLPGYFCLKIPYEIKDLFKQSFDFIYDPREKSWLIRENDLEKLKIFCDTNKMGLTIERNAKKAFYEIEDAKTIKHASDFKLEDLEFANALYPYQRVGIKFLTTHGNKILADEMGLGKSVQVIGALLSLKANSYLIVVPNSLKYTWFNEIKKWAPNEEVTIVEGSKSKKIQTIKQSKKIITNYEILINSEYTEAMPEYDVVVYDESTYLKNYKAKRTLGALRVKAKKIIMVTGTPITKNPADLFAQLKIMYPQLYNNFWKFAETYCLIENINLKDRTVKKVYGVKNEDRLIKELQPLLIRRTQSEVTNFLPDLIEEEIELSFADMDKYQYEIYKAFYDGLSNAIDEENRSSVLKLITKMQEVLESPINIDGDGKSLKIDALLDLINTYNDGEKSFVIWTKYVKTAELIANKLNNDILGSASCITGDIPASEREKRIKQFLAGTTQFLVLTLSVGKYGYSFTFPNRPIVSIFLSRSYSFEEMEQAKMRVKRVTTRIAPVVLYLHVKGSIDDDIKASLEKKKDIFDILFSKKKKVMT